MLMLAVYESSRRLQTQLNSTSVFAGPETLGVGPEEAEEAPAKPDRAPEVITREGKTRPGFIGKHKLLVPSLNRTISAA